MLSRKSHQTVRNLIPAFIIPLFIFCLLVLFSGCKKDTENPSSTQKIKFDANFTTTNLATSAYNITSSLPKGYVTDGSVDYTTYLAAAVKQYSNITFPGFPILINSNGLVIPSNRTLTFLPGSQLILKPSSDGNYTVLRIQNATNVVLNNPVIVGDYLQHIGTAGEWGDGIGIYASSNVTINSPNVTSCWGDGIYLSATKNGVVNSNIKILNAQITNNRRNGITIASVIGLDLESPISTYSGGTSPMCGIDIEPQGPADELQNIVINNPNTGHSGGNGIQIGYSNLYGGSNKVTSITINNQTDKKSLIGFRTSCNISKRVGSETISGTLNINNPVWRENPNGPIIESLYEPNIKMTVTSPSIENVNGVYISQQDILNWFGDLHHILVGSNYSLTL